MIQFVVVQELVFGWKIGDLSCLNQEGSAIINLYKYDENVVHFLYMYVRELFQFGKCLGTIGPKRVGSLRP